MRSRLRLISPLLPLAAIALLLVEILAPSAVWEALTVALGGALFASYLWARSLHKGLRLERLMRFGWAQVGDVLEEQFVLTSRSFLPAPWVEVMDHSDLPGYQASVGTCTASFETASWRTRGICSRRGIYTLGDTTLRTGDPFGIFSVELHYPETATLMVMPPVVPLPDIDVAPGGWLGDGRLHPNAAEKVFSASTVRPYQPGDSLRLIHWRTTARRNEPYVHLLEGSPSGAWWILLDLHAAAQAGEGEASTVEAGIILAASLADRGLRARKDVGFVASGTEPVWMPPRGGEPRRVEILRALAGLSPGDIPLSALLERSGPALGRQASLIVITPSTGSDWLKPLGHLAWRGITPTVILLDPASFGAAEAAGPLAALLADMGITRHVITREILDHPQAHPRGRGQWEWRILPTGKAIPTRLPGDMSWKRLA